MSDAEQFAGLEMFLADRGAALLRTAVLLTGSREAGEDLLQLALERALRRWQRVDGDPEPYLRQTLYHLAVDRWRIRHPEVDLTADLAPSGRDLAAEVELRDAALMRAASPSPTASPSGSPSHPRVPVHVVQSGTDSLVIAMALGNCPAVMALPGVLATLMPVPVGVTVPELLTAQAVLPSGIIRIVSGILPTSIGVSACLMAVSIGVIIPRTNAPSPQIR